MPSAAAVIRYDGKRGVVWRIKYRDATGRQQQETLGRERNGWTRKKAEAALRERLVAVEKDGYKKAQPICFDEFALEWLTTYAVARGLKRSTAQGYKQIIVKWLIPAFGSKRLGAISVRDGDAYVAARVQAGAAPQTINNELNLLSNILGGAIRHGRIQRNPVEFVVRPRVVRQQSPTLEPKEVAAVAEAFTTLAERTVGEARARIAQARTIFLVTFTLGLRRGELLGLHWRGVSLADPDGANLRIEETWVRSGVDTPKSHAGRRTIPIGPRVAEELWQHRNRTAYRGDDARVFVSPTKGTPFDTDRYSKILREAFALAGVTKNLRPFHGGRHTSITSDAITGSSAVSLMTRAGHSSFSTTQRYIQAAGLAFKDEAIRAEERILGAVPVQSSGTNSARAASSDNEATARATSEEAI